MGLADSSHGRQVYFSCMDLENFSGVGGRGPASD